MPVEITDFCWKYNLQRLQNLPEVKGCEAKLRHNADGTPYVTDNKNYIVDLYFKTPIKVHASCQHSCFVESSTSHQPYNKPTTHKTTADTGGIIQHLQIHSFICCDLKQAESILNSWLQVLHCRLG